MVSGLAEDVGPESGAGAVGGAAPGADRGGLVSCDFRRTTARGWRSLSRNFGGRGMRSHWISMLVYMVLFVRGARADGALDRLNACTPAELEALPALGPVLTARLLEARDRSALGFGSWQAVEAVNGFGPMRCAQLKQALSGASEGPGLARARGDSSCPHEDTRLTRVMESGSIHRAPPCPHEGTPRVRRPCIPGRRRALDGIREAAWLAGVVQVVAASGPGQRGSWGTALRDDRPGSPPPASGPEHAGQEPAKSPRGAASRSVALPPRAITSRPEPGSDPSHPARGDGAPPPPSWPSGKDPARRAEGARRAPDPRLDLNAATVEELARLPGITRELAAAIHAEREKNGAFDLVEEMLVIPGITPAVLDSWRPAVRLGSP